MAIKYLLVFLAGFLSCAFIFYGFLNTPLEFPFGTGLLSYDLSAPSNWINDEDIILLDDRIILKINDATLSSYAPTGSMKPLFDEGANGIRIVPKSEDDIEVGDIVSFRVGEYLVVHRVVDKRIDEEGVYFLTKGDNNILSDGKIRFDDIKYVTIGVLW